VYEHLSKEVVRGGKVIKIAILHDVSAALFKLTLYCTLVVTNHLQQRWSRSKSAGVDSHYVETGARVKI